MKRRAVSSIPEPRGWVRALGWRRVVAPLVMSLLAGLLMARDSASPAAGFLRTVLVGVFATVVFRMLELWPRRLPGWLSRWVLQVVGVGLSVPLATFGLYVVSTDAGAPAFWDDPGRLPAFMNLTVLGMFLAPWMALGALDRQKDSFARRQALAFELERSELERQALDARLHLLQAQVAPHFLFNTLANVRELVDAGSPQASKVLASLIAYLRAAVPRLHEPATTLGQELDLVRAYLDVMHIRMPDRLQFTVEADADARALSCPPMTLLTLVENAVRHGIDPSEDGGRIEVRVRVHAGRCTCEVVDTGVGLRHASDATGTGLAMLRERMQLAFGSEAELRVQAIEPHGVRAELRFPARRSDT